MPARWTASIHPKPGCAKAEQFDLEPHECIDRGVRVAVYPVAAIFPDEDMPDNWARFEKINADHFGHKEGSSGESLKEEKRDAGSKSSGRSAVGDWL